MRHKASLALLLCAAAAAGQPAAEAPKLLDAFAFRHIGPIGNRVSAVAGVPGDPGTWYAGAASGGLWRSTDGGVGWEPIFDRQEAASIGSIAVAPSDPNVVWVGTGESFIRSNISIGNGVYRSTDRGDSFDHLGLEASGRIGRIIVHPEDADTALVAALGHAYGPQGPTEAARGVFRTTDGGATWEHILFVDADTGVVDLAFAPDNPRFVYAAAFATSPDDPEAVYAGSQYVHRSRDRGQSWERISPDLTTADPALMRRTGGLTLDDAGPTIAPVVFAIAESPLEPGLIWAGTNDGQVQLTRATAGLHRVTWDLRQDPTIEVRLRTRPDERPDWEMPERGWRPLPDGGRFSMLAAAGGYLLELVIPTGNDEADEAEPASTVDMDLLLDPDSTASASDLASQQALLVDIRDGIERAAELINEAERLRRDLRQLEDHLSESGGDIDVFRATNQAGSLREGLRAIEGEFFDLRMTGTGQDSLRWPRRLYARLTYLARSVGHADARPTDQQTAVWRMLSDELAAQEGRFDATLAGPLRTCGFGRFEVGVGEQRYGKLRRCHAGGVRGRRWRMGWLRSRREVRLRSAGREVRTNAPQARRRHLRLPRKDAPLRLVPAGQPASCNGDADPRQRLLR